MFTGLKELYIAKRNNLIARGHKLDKTQNDQWLSNHFSLCGKPFDDINSYISVCKIGYSVCEVGFEYTKLGQGYGCYHCINPYHLEAKLCPNYDIKFDNLGCINLSLYDKTNNKNYNTNYVCTLKSKHMDIVVVHGNTPKSTVQNAVKHFQKINYKYLTNIIKFYKQQITRDTNYLGDLK